MTDLDKHRIILFTKIKILVPTQSDEVGTHTHDIKLCPASTLLYFILLPRRNTFPYNCLSFQPLRGTPSFNTHQAPAPSSQPRLGGSGCQQGCQRTQRSARPSPRDLHKPGLLGPHARQGRLESLRNHDLPTLPLPPGKGLPWECDGSQQHSGDVPSPTKVANTKK